MTVQDSEQRRQVESFFAGSADYWRTLYDGQEPFNAYAYAYHRRLANALHLIETHGATAVPTLDVGCGAGILVTKLAHRGFDATGVDLVPEMISTARGVAEKRPELAERVHFEVADIGKLPFEDDRFEVVTALGVIEYLDDPPAALGELRRVLRPGGLLVFSVPNAASPLRRFGRQLTGLLRRGRDARLLRVLKYRLLLRQPDVGANFQEAGGYRHQAYTAAAVHALLSDTGFVPLGDIYQVYGIRISDVWLPLPFALVRRLEWLDQHRLTRHFGADYLVGARLSGGA